MVATPQLPEGHRTYKLAVIGIVTSEADGRKRKEMEDAVWRALVGIEGVQVHQQFFMYDDVNITLRPSAVVELPNGE